MLSAQFKTKPLARFSRPPFLALSILATAGLAQAQVPPDAGSLLEQQRQGERRPGVPTTPPAIAPEAAQPAAPAAAQQRVKIKSFKLGGKITAFPPEELLALLDDLIGKELSFAELQAAATRIASHYHDHGYFLAKAYLPRQDITAGDIIVVIQEGVLDSAPDGVRIQPAPSLKENGLALRLDDRRAQDLVTGSTVPGKPLRQKELERAILLLNDLPGVAASANLEPGSAPGSTRLVVEVNEGPLVTGSVGADNTGSRVTGATHVNAGVNLNDPSGMGDQITLSTSLSEIPGNHYERVAYTLPVGSDGLKLGLAYSHLAYAVGLELATSKARGTAESASFSATYPLIRTRLFTLRLNGNFEHKTLYDESLGNAINRKRIDLANLGLAWENSDPWGGGGFNQAALTVTAGNIDLGGVRAALVADQAATGPHANGSYNKIGYSLTRLQHGTEKLSLMANLNGQFAGKNLDSSEKIQFGGPYGVRAYPVGEASGDEGHKLTLEARYLLAAGTVVGDIQGTAFYDTARITANRDAGRLVLTTPNAYDIAGWGLGLVFGKPGKQDIRLTYAQKLGSNPVRNLTTGKDSDGSADNARLWLTANLYF